MHVCVVGSFRLTYKTGKTDCKIVRSILQAHGFMEVYTAVRNYVYITESMVYICHGLLGNNESFVR